MELSTKDGAGVLIESDWNLKECICHRCTPDRPRINRIRLEFKGQKTDRKNQNRKRINRIRLEFKAFKVVTSEDQW